LTACSRFAAANHFTGSTSYGRKKQYNLAPFSRFIKREPNMVKIRLSRGGAKKKPFYHIVVADIRSRRDGRSIERLGFFDPVARGNSERLRLDMARVDHWTANGAIMTDRVAALVRNQRKALAVETAAPAA
jgi:small subunit ribosomal protein S16